MPSTLACPGLCAGTIHTCLHDDCENVDGDGQAGMTHTPPLPCHFAANFLGEGLKSTQASCKEVHMPPHKVDNAPAIWDLEALGNCVGDILRGGLKVGKHLSIKRGSQASWQVEDQVAGRWRLHHGQMW